MPYEIEFDMPPAGYTLTSARKNEDVTVQFSEFTSTEDGQHFIQRLEGFPQEVLTKLPVQVAPSQVDTLLAIINREGKATVYLNEVVQKALMRINRAMERGAEVTKNDVVDVHRLELDVTIPDDFGVVYVFSIGWRKGLFYDFGPIAGPSPEPRKYDLSSLLGRAYCHVLFQERFSISDSEWEKLFAAKWFPFSGLRHDLIEAFVAHVRAGWDLDEMLDDVEVGLNNQHADMVKAWRGHQSFAPHVEIFEHAFERFKAHDYVSCTGLVFPRIEGLMRTHHTSLGVSTRPSPDNLANLAVASKITNDRCLLLPHKFARYLQEVYFANFNPVAHSIDVSRHSVAHGVASASQFDRKSAAIGLLVAHQLFYFLEQPQQ
jgi:hypothetical protein